METQHTSWQNRWFPLKSPPLNHSNDLFYLGKGQEIATRRRFALAWDRDGVNSWRPRHPGRHGRNG